MQKFMIKKVPGDGSCFYHSVLVGLRDKPLSSSLKSKINVQYLRKLVAKKIEVMYNNDVDKSFVDFYINDTSNSLEKYINATLKNMWAGPLEAYALSKSLKIRIQVYNFSDLKKYQDYYKSLKDPIIDFGDKRKKPVKVVIYGFDFTDRNTGFHYDALIILPS